MATAVGFEKKYPELVSRGIDQSTWSALQNSLYTGASDNSIIMVVDYCKARNLDPMMKPVHIVPMSVKKPGGDGYMMKDTIMAGIGMYRIQAERSGKHAGTSKAVFGPDVTAQLGGASVTYPDWCEVTVSKYVGKNIVEYCVREYWLENYATKSRNDEQPNTMWKKRAKAQLSKCTESAALRKAFPDTIGADPTFQEMEGKIERDITPPKKKSLVQQLMKVDEPDMAWFDNIIDSISNATKLEELGALYDLGVNECKANKNTEAVEFIATACRQKEEHLLTNQEEKGG